MRATGPLPPAGGGVRSNPTTRTAKQIGPATAARSRVCGAPPLPPTRWSSPLLDLYRPVGFRGLSGDRLALTAVVAITLAHARKEIRQHPAASVGRAAFADKEFETAAMKPMRFSACSRRACRPIWCARCVV